MKFKFILITLIAICAFTVNAQQIANNSFENWTTGAGPSTPVSWDSYDDMLYGLSGVIGTVPQRGWCTKETTPADVYSGSASVKLMTDTVSIAAFGSTPVQIPGSVFWGTLTFSLTAGKPVYTGVPYAYRPLSFSGALKYAPNGSDTGAFFLSLTKWDAVHQTEILVAGDQGGFVSTGGGWVVFNDTLAYATNDTPDSAWLNFTSSYDQGKIGSVLWVDSLGLQGQAQTVSVQVTSHNVTCPGARDGSATATPSGGSNYTYNWSNGQSTSTIGDLSPGTYYVTVTSGGTLSVVDSAVIHDAAPFSVVVITTTTTCGNSSGTATANVTSDTTVTSYLWSNSSTTNPIISLPQGTYSVTVQNANGCTTTGSGTVTNTNGPSVTFTSSEPKCYFSTNGNIVAHATGGTGPYTYIWSGGSLTGNDTLTNDTLAQIGSGMYSVTVTDHSGCSTPGTDSLGQPIFVSNNVTTTPSSGSNGTATVVPSGGTPPYTFVWGNSDTSATITGLAPGTYQVTITDSHGCTDPGQGTVAQASNITITFSSKEPSCYTSTNGWIVAAPTGGTSPYTFVWSPTGGTMSGDTLKGIGAGTYTVTVTDANNNTIVGTDSLGQPTFVSNSITNTPSSGSNGTATVTASGGTSPYTYSWNNGQTTAAITGLAPGTYSVTITDSHGCTDNGSTTIVSVGINTIGSIITGVNLYPNPANDQLTLSIDLEQIHTVNIRVTDLTGKLVYATSEAGSGKLNRQIDVRSFSAGIYILEVTAGEDAARNRFVVAH